jgi:hypothetical protein
MVFKDLPLLELDWTGNCFLPRTEVDLVALTVDEP